MRRQIAEKTDELIHRYAVHANGAPVDLSPLDEEFLPVLRPLTELGGNALTMPPQSGETSITAPAVVMIEELLPTRLQERFSTLTRLGISSAAIPEVSAPSKLATGGTSAMSARRRKWPRGC